ncbi:hypothetical protein [Streptomyces sp. GESEQ-35]|uniref:hypothetical protein n=1 Tax=Streptomyces sp. GESEQ-35 TaxID=2812657 RepID=UPI001B321679|nr:hypothetical protein [Streptomyces sp. GESEQ-35]
MKSWRSRVAAFLAVGAAAIAIPLTASPAHAGPPPGGGWEQQGATTYDSRSECALMEWDGLLQNWGEYDKLYCDGNGGHDQYQIYYHHR